MRGRIDRFKDSLSVVKNHVKFIKKKSHNRTGQQVKENSLKMNINDFRFH